MMQMLTLVLWAALDSQPHDHPEWHAAEAAHASADCAAEAHWLSRLPNVHQRNEAVLVRRVDALVCSGQAAAAVALLQARLAEDAPSDERARLTTMLGQSMERARADAVATSPKPNEGARERRVLARRAGAIAAGLGLASVQLAVLGPAVAWGLSLQDFARFDVSGWQNNLQPPLWPLPLVFVGAVFIVVFIAPFFVAAAAVGGVSVLVAAGAGALFLAVVRDVARALGRPSSSLRRFLPGVLIMLAGLGTAFLLVAATPPTVFFAQDGLVTSTWNPLSDKTRSSPSPATRAGWVLFLAPPLMLAAGAVVVASAAATWWVLNPADDGPP